MIPDWLHTLALISLVTAGACCVLILADILGGHPQKMAVMNWVWPITALYMGPFALLFYYDLGRQKEKNPDKPMGVGHAVGGPGALHPHEGHGPEGERGERKDDDQKGKKASWRSVFTGVTHCGAGCTLGDFAGDWLVYAAGWTIAGIALWPKIMAEFICAFLLGIVFQYFAIAPMRHLGPKEGIFAAVKADALSITAFEVGMFAWMLLSRFVFFGRDLPPTEPVYWLMMQIAMLLGFATSYPMNRWLIKKGWKEAM